MRSLVLCLLLPSIALGQDFAMEPGPKSPQDSLKCMQARPGFTVELLACEPAVMDPIAFAWGPDGKFWVVEMGDYPLGVDGKGKKGGRVKILEKSKPGGMYDKATVFLDDLGYPTGVFPWKKGALITCAPDILYAEDANGDGKADKVEKLYTGFREGNQQHRVNGLTWGLDNWIYGANGDSGGTVKSIKTGKAVNINGRDFRIKPDTGEIEATTGQSQFGRARDDWGNWFGNNNSNPMFHYVLEDRYLRRNPTLLFTDVKVHVSEKPGAARVYPISKPLPRFNTPAAVNHFTSACSAIIYRDDLFGKDFEGNSFVAEPVHNLVHREIVRAEGITFRSKRADDEQESEFLASSDNWFRPAMIQTGPDGALWIADMYRYVIEHPEWIPKEWQKKLDLRAGHDRGRIYRVFPKGKKPREIPDLTKFKDEEWVAALESPNGWLRDMVHQQIVTQQAKPKSVLKCLESKSPLARMHCLMILSGGDDVRSRADLREQTLRFLFPDWLQDKHPGMRKHTLILLEKYFRAGSPWSEPFQQALSGLVNDPDEQVRLQLAYSLGETPQGAVLLNELARQPKNRHFDAALASSVNATTYAGFVALMRENPDNLADKLVAPLLKYTIFSKKTIEPGLFVRTLGDKVKASNFATLADICESLESQKASLSAVYGKDKIEKAKNTVERLNEIFELARTYTTDEKASSADRVAAIRLLGRGTDRKAEDLRRLESLLDPSIPVELQSAALTQFAKVGDEQTPRTIIKKWKHLSPTLRGAAFDTLTARKEWTAITLIHLETKAIRPSELDAARRQRLLTHPDPETRTRAERILASSTTKDRQKAIDDYLLALTLNGDAKKGAKMFARVCASCHRLEEVGQNVGPDLASVGDRTPGGLLNAILDPNRAVEARYINYLAETKAGVTYTGILAAETSTSITLIAVDGKKTDILRGDLEELSSTGKSAMPEGLEKDISVQEMADLLAYLTTYLPPKLERSENK